MSTLKPGTDGYHLIVKVMEVIPVVDKIRRDGTRVRVALIVIADAEASVVFVARGGIAFHYFFHFSLLDQIDIMTVGSTVQILNAKVEMFNLYDRENESKSRNGFMRLEVEKWGKVEYLEYTSKVLVLIFRLSLMPLYKVQSAPRVCQLLNMNLLKKPKTIKINNNNFINFVKSVMNKY